MTEKHKDDDSSIVLGRLTEDQKTLLFQALEIVKQRVHSDVAKKLRNYLLIGFSLVTLFGAVSVVGLKTAIKDATVGALREDSNLRLAIKEDAAVKVTQAAKIVEELNGILEKAKATKLSIAKETLEELHSVLEMAKVEKQEDNLLFENSARELNELIDELKRLKDREKTRIGKPDQK